MKLQNFCNLCRPLQQTPTLPFPFPMKRTPLLLSVTIASLALGTLRAGAVTANFTNLGGDNAYTNNNNWDTFVVPNVSNGDTAIIGNGSAVTYTPGGDLVVKNNGILQITSGSFTQVGGNNYLQLNGNGSIVVNGGTFNQGTVSSSPFNVTGTGNAFTVSAGTANINNNFVIPAGLNFTMSGGTVNAPGETDFNAPLSTMSGGVFNTGLITGANGAGTTVFSLSGGTLSLSSSRFNGFYNGSATHYINFTLGSTAQIVFNASTGATLTTVRGFVSSGGIELNNAPTTASSFNIVQDASGNITVSLVGTAVPEPSAVALMGLGAAGLVGWATRRRRARMA